VVKLVLTLVATAVLLLYNQTLDALAEAARHASTASLVSGDLVDASPLVHRLAALLLLLGAIVLSVFKPSGADRLRVARERLVDRGRRHIAEEVDLAEFVDERGPRDCAAFGRQ
jgi:hypothetical protein